MEVGGKLDAGLIRWLCDTVPWLREGRNALLSPR